MKNPKKNTHRRSRRQANRTLQTEQLERREMLTAYWQNPARPLDTNNDTHVSPLDALLVINYLNDPTTEARPGTRLNSLETFVDTNGDQFVSPIDVLIIVNELNGNPGGPTYPIVRRPGGSESGPAGFISRTLMRIPGEAGETMEVDIALESANRSFYEVGLFPVDDESGSINGVATTAENYPFEAFNLPEKQVIFSHQGQQATSGKAVFEGGEWIAVYVLQRTSRIGDANAHLSIDLLSATEFQISWNELRPGQTPTPPPFDDSRLAGEVRPINLNPDIVSTPISVIGDNSSYQYDVQAEDPDGDILSYELLAAPEGMAIDPSGGQISWPGDRSEVGSYYVELQVTDARGGFRTQEFSLEVVENLPNRPPVIISKPETTIQLDETAAKYSRRTVEFDDWTRVEFDFENRNDADWVVDRAGQRVRQTTGSDATFFLSDFQIANHRFEGNLQSNFYFGGGFTGLVFGYEDNSNFLLFDWKQSYSEDSRGIARQGMSVKRFSSDQPLTVPDFWQTVVSPEAGELLFHNELTWDRSLYTLTLEQSPGHVRLVISTEETILETIELDIPELQGGRVGFYTHQQSPSTFEDFTLTELGGEQYRHNVIATDADGDILSYRLVDSPRDMSIDTQSGALTWQPSFQDAGNHSIAIEVADGRGGIATQEFIICVHEAATNADPQIISAPVTEYDFRSAPMAYQYQVQAFDPESDLLTYSLVDPPRGMRIGPQTGLISWPAEDARAQSGRFFDAPRGWYAVGGIAQVKILVEDGRGGSTTQEFDLFSYDAAPSHISGYVYEDLNRNGQLDTNFVEGDDPYLVFVVDNSCSMDDLFTGEQVGDQNGDDRFNTLLDAALTGIRILADRLSEDPRQKDVRISIVDFNRPLDMDSVAAGHQYFVGLGADTDGNGIRDFEDVFQDLQTGCGGTNYERALENAIEALEAETSAADSLNVLFMTDGVPERSGPYADDVQALLAMGVNLQGLGIGRGTLSDPLREIDPNAHELSYTREVLETFGGLDVTGFETAEPVLSGWTVYLDENRNGLLDLEEPSAVSDQDGYYEFPAIGVGEHSVRAIVPEGWNQQAPLRGNYEAVMFGGGERRAFNFGNIQSDSDDSSLAPTFASLPDMLATTGVLFRYDTLASAADGKPVEYQLVLGPSNATLHPEAGILLWQPRQEDNGANDFIIRATDHAGRATNQSFQIEVVSENTPPNVISQPPSVWPIGIATSYHLDATDPEFDSVSYAVLDAPSDLTLDSDSGRLRWTPDDSPEGIMISDGAIGYWPFNEPPETTLAEDASGHGRDATIPGSATKTAGRSYADNDFALELNNWRDRMAHPHTGEIQPEKFSVEGWIKPSAGGFGWILDRHFDQSSYGSGLSFAPSAISFGVNRTHLSHELELDVWSHVVGVFNGDEIALYVNGEEVGRRIFYRPFQRSTYDFATGGEGIAVDDIALFDYELTPEQIASHYSDSIQSPRTVKIEVSDERGAASVYSFDIYTSNSTGGQPPTITSTLPARAFVGYQLVHQVRASDNTGDGLSYHLREAPTGMSIDSRGVLRWTPSSGQLNEHSVIVEVTDSNGESSSQSYLINVVAQLQNRPPKITAISWRSAVAGHPVAIDASALEPDGDQLHWTLDNAPAGASIDAWTGQIRWLPTHDQLGSHAFVVSVHDYLGGRDEQRFDITVSCANSHPQIVSIPSVRVHMGEKYSYAAKAFDAEQDSLDWSLLNPPAGMQVDKDGYITWMPTETHLGKHNVQLLVSDGINTQHQEYELEVVDPESTNRAPVITSHPKYHARTGSVYAYQFSAVDPDGDAVSYSLEGDVPVGMQLDSSGNLTWIPTISQSGAHLVNLVATDSLGLNSTQTFLLDVEENLPPLITSTPAESIAVGAEYTHLLKAYDPEFGPLGFRLDDAPEGMRMDALGRIVWQTSQASVSPASVTVTAIDEFGLETSKSWQIELVPDTENPIAQVSIHINNRNYVGDATLDIGSIFRVRVSGSDNAAVASYQLFVDGDVVILDEHGFATMQADRIGDIELVGQVTDTSGLIGTDSIVLHVEDPATRNVPIPTDPSLPPNPGMDPSDNGIPSIEITSPEPASTVSNLVPIVGTVDDPEDNLWFYRVYYARADRVDLTALDMEDSDWILLRTSTAEVHDGELAVFDTSLVSNDPYTIAVEAYDANGQGYIQPTMVYVEGNVQVDNFRIDITDLSIPLAGIPIQVTRTYDTLNSLDDGDFGFGWNLSIADPRIFEAAAIGAGGALTPGNDKFVPGKTKVYLTNPSGKRVGFTYQEQLQIGGLFGAIFRPYFEPDAGVYDQLLIDETQVVRGQIGGDFGQGINPDHYTLVTKEGIEYRYSDNAGLKTVRDRSGNVLTVTGKGMQHSSGQTIEFIRDNQGRIVSIVDPAGNTIEYRYTSAGDLDTVTNQSGLATRYTYRDDLPHYLDEAYNSLGSRVLKVQYDEHGKFVGVVDALGNVTQQQFDSSANTGIVRDTLGNETTLVYDDRGNVLREVDAQGNATIREYSDTRNPDLETRIVDRNGNVTERSYDGRGNVVRVIEKGSVDAPLMEPIATIFAYDDQNNVRAITNAQGFTTTFDYDARSQLTRITNSEGNRSSFTYDAEGRRASFTDFNGNTTTFDYTVACPCGSPSQVNFADGTYQTFQYNEFAQVTEEAWYEADGTLVEISQTEYDSLGRPTEERRGLAGDDKQPQTVVRKFYNGHLLDWEVVIHPDSLASDGSLLESPTTPFDIRKSRITRYDYDDADRLIRQTDAEGGVVEFRYDGNGNRILLRDPVGNITTWLYDSLGRVVEERDPFYNDGLTIEQAIAALAAPSGADLDANVGADHVRAFRYDGEGNQVELIDRNGRRREFEYDLSGRLLSESWFDADVGDLVETIAFSYDTLGNMLTSSDSNSRYLYTYDSLNRLTSVDNNPKQDRDVPRVILSYDYDAQGNVTRTQDDAGVTVDSSYDVRNRLADRQWFDALILGGETADVDPVHIEFDYNAASRESEVRRYSGLDNSNLIGRTLRTYDNVGRSNLLNHVNAVDELLSGYDYDYDFGSLLVHEERTHQDAQYSQFIDYRYDLTGQLVDATFSGQEDEHFQYDPNGNRITSRLGSQVSNYTTGRANQLTSDGTHRYEYDGEGNQIKRVHLTTGETRTMQYDHHNRLVRVDDWSSDPGDPNAHVAGVVLTQSVEYIYDAHGRRTARSVDADGQRAQPAEKEFFVYNGDNVWADIDESRTTIGRHLLGRRIDSNIARVGSSGNVIWALPDQLGSQRDSLDGTSFAYHHIDYRVFGGPVPESQIPNGRYQFTGREYDFALENYFYRARQYLSQLGSFLQRDPLGFDAVDANLYRYVGNSPASGTDPTGTTLVESSTLNSGLSKPQLALASGTLGGIVGIKGTICRVVVQGPGSVDIYDIGESIFVGFATGFVLGYLGGLTQGSAIATATGVGCSDLLLEYVERL